MYTGEFSVSLVKPAFTFIDVGGIWPKQVKGIKTKAWYIY